MIVAMLAGSHHPVPVGCGLKIQNVKKHFALTECGFRCFVEECSP